MDGPGRVAFSDHAAERAERYGVPFTDVADAVLDGHAQRQRNVGSGDWIVTRGSLAVVYNWPDEGDALTARVVTLWSAQ